MKVQPIKTVRIAAGSMSLTGLIDTILPQISEGSIVAITSKIVSLCENNVVAQESVAKEELIKKEADRYYAKVNPYGFLFTIKNNTLIPSAGIDESNSGGVYVLWPKDAQKSANNIREYIVKRTSVAKIGVIITDSTCTPMRRGTSGICLAHSGFKALNNYIGKPDLFGRDFKVSQANIAGGLAAAAVLAMGEGDEQTPLCLIEDVGFVQFQDQNPSKEELSQFYIPLEEDLFEPFLSLIKWDKGGAGR